MKSNSIDNKNQNVFPSVIFKQAVAGDATLILTNKGIKMAGGSNKHIKWRKCTYRAFLLTLFIDLYRLFNKYYFKYNFLCIFFLHFIFRCSCEYIVSDLMTT